MVKENIDLPLLNLALLLHFRDKFGSKCPFMSEIVIEKAVRSFQRIVKRSGS